MPPMPPWKPVVPPWVQRGKEVPLRIQRLTEWLKAAGRTTVLWTAGSLRGCLCENEQVEPCAICAAVAKGDQFDLRAAQAAVQDDAQRASGVTMTRHGTFEIYEDGKGYFWWRVRGPHGEDLGQSSEGFVVREDCAANAAQVGVALVAAMAAELAGR